MRVKEIKDLLSYPFLLFICAVMIFIPASEVNANYVAVFQNWQVTYEGDIIGFDPAILDSPLNQGLYYDFMTKTTATSSTPWPLNLSASEPCPGGGGIGATLEGFIGLNVFDGGGIGEGNCSAPGEYWFYVADTDSSDVQWAFKVIYDGVGVVAAQQVEGGIPGYDTPIISSTSTIDTLTLQCDPNANFFEHSVCSVGVFLFVPNPSIYQNFTDAKSVLDIHLPFSLFGEFRTIFLGVSPGTPPATSVSFTLPWSEEPFHVISTSTITTYFGSSWSGMQTAMAGVLIFLLGWAYYHRLTKILS